MHDPNVNLLLTQLDNLLLNRPEMNVPLTLAPPYDALEERLVKLSYHLAQCKRFAQDMAQGKFATPVPPRDHYISASLKALQASILHFSWELAQLATGDCSQKSQYMGLLSQSYNQIAALLGARAHDMKHDALTGASNFDVFKADASFLLKQDGQHALVLINVDRFKVFNDTFGFDVGDKLIRIIAQTIEQGLAPGERYGRYVADQFFVLLRHQSCDDTVGRVMCMLEQAEEVFSWSIHKYYRLILLAGVCIIGDKAEPEESFDAYTNKARYALKDVTSKQKSCVALYNRQLRQQLIRGIEFESKMNLALKNREFHLYLQPKYRLSDETIVGVEALVRWIDNKQCVISPTEFIGVFEKNGFMVELDMYMLRQACKLIRDWLDRGLTPVTISVNFSRLHLTNENFVSELVGIVKRYDIPSNFIEIELTESIIFDNTQHLIKVINQLHAQGFTLSMDDFGSGYSSLGLLKDLPIDVIKLDRSFFTDYIDFQRGRAVVDAVISMARALGIQTVAEGVETKEHIEMLKRFECDIVQGFYYAKPMCANDFNLLMYPVSFAQNQL